MKFQTLQPGRLSCADYDPLLPFQELLDWNEVSATAGCVLCHIDALLTSIATSAGINPHTLCPSPNGLAYSKLWSSLAAQIAITVHRREMHLIPQFIAAFDVKRAQRRLAELRQMWTYEFSEQYVIDRLRREHCYPAPVSTWNDL